MSRAGRGRLVGILLAGFLLFSLKGWARGNTDASGSGAGDVWALHARMPPTGPVVRHYEPMVMGCGDLKPLWGAPFSNLRLYAWRDGAWRMITHQIDDRLPDNRMVFTQGPQQNADAGNRRLDGPDELTFMVRDAGKRHATGHWPAGADRGMEIKLIDPVTGDQGFVYLIHFDRAVPEEEPNELLIADDSGPRYTGGSHLWQVQGISNVHRGRLYKTLVNEKVVIPPLAGGSGINFVDRTKYRIELRFLFGMLRLKIDENNLIGEVSQYRSGPLRLSVRNWGQIMLPARFKSPKLWAEMYLFETFVVVPTTIRVPFNPGAIITDFRMSLGYDLNEHAEGMTFYNSNNLEGFTVDGIPSDEERNMNTDPDQWRCVTGPPGTILTYSVWDEGYREQAEIKVRFIDDRRVSLPPENVPGQMGYFFNESKIESLEPRAYSLVFYICFPPFFYDSDRLRTDLISEYVNIRHHPVYAVVEGVVNSNRVAYPEPMWPEVE